MKFTRPTILITLVLWSTFATNFHAKTPRSRARGVDCDMLCASLMKAIQDNPDTLVMKLEDALVINEACAGDIVTAAISAVGAEPSMVKKIVETAINVAPTRTASIHRSVTHFTPIAATARPFEEVRRPELPDGLPAMLVEEVRRAEHPGDSTPLMEIRRAEVPSAMAMTGLNVTDMSTGANASSGAGSSDTHEEVRRAVVPTKKLSFAAPQLAPPVNKKRNR